jgi:3-hydroxyacyl-CoA dehydrogenase
MVIEGPEIRNSSRRYSRNVMSLPCHYLTTNTSNMSITKIAQRPSGQISAGSLFQPVAMMTLVEVIREKTSNETMDVILTS